MERNDPRYQTYVAILEKELIPAMGCTEPIAIAFAAAKTREVLGKLPKQVLVEASGNIIKNVKSVIVPNTNGKKGIEAAAAIGIVAGEADKNLEVIAQISDEQKLLLDQYLQTADIRVLPADSPFVLDITVTAKAEGETAKVRIVNEHTNIVYVEKNGTILEEKPLTQDEEKDSLDYELLTVEDILEFADTVVLEDVQAVLERQISYNQAISQEGLRHTYGANIGKVLLCGHEADVKIRAKAEAAAGSDARMNGCELPVVINSGSGNQGITSSIPVLVYGREWKAGQEKIYRALLVSNLVTLHLKTGIGRLSAYCGAVSAGAGAGAGIAYLYDGNLDTIAHTIVNTLAITSGIVCDGAKASCAAKIAAAVDAGILGLEMYQNGQQFYGGDGLVSQGVENTIRNIGILGREGMREADRTIIELMTAGC